MRPRQAERLLYCRRPIDKHDGATVEDIEALVVRAQAGDLDAYGRIVCRFQDMAFGYAYTILGDLHLAEDAAQEAFTRGYRDLRSRQPVQHRQHHGHHRDYRQSGG